MLSYRYLVDNFLSLEQLARAAGVTPSQVEEIIAAGCLPEPAYRFSARGVIGSFFGEHEEIIEQLFFPRSHIAKVEAVLVSPIGGAALVLEQKEAFFRDYALALEALQADRFGMPELFDGQGRACGVALAALLEKEWQSYQSGTYGLCTKTATATDIATKEAMIAKIKFLCAKFDAGLGSGFLVTELASAVDLLDTVSASFAPHERPISSRHRYIDKVRETYLMAETSAA